MGKRDKGGHEAKKPKKDAKKPVLGEIIAPPASVDVVKKKRKSED